MGTLLRRLVVLVFVEIAVVLASGGVAHADTWSPEQVDSGEWHVVRIDIPDDPGVITEFEKCPQLVSSWEKVDSVAVTARTLTCDSSGDAARLAGVLRNQHDIMDVEPVFGAEVDFAVELAKVPPPVVVRVWAEGNRVLAIEMLCRNIDTGACLQLLDRMTESLSAHQPGEPVRFRSTFQSFVSVAMSSLFLAWLILVGIPAGVRLIRRNRYPLGSGVTWSNVERRAWWLRLRSIAWGTCVGLRRFCYILLMLSAATLVNGSRAYAVVVGIFAIIVAVLLTLGSMRIWDPLFGGIQGWRRERHSARSTGHLLFGLVLRFVAQGGLLVFVISLLLSLWIESEGGFSSPTVVQSGLYELIEAGDAGWMAYYVATLAMIGAAGLSTLLVFIIFGSLVLLLAIDQLGRRFLSPKIRVDRLPSERPQILYLRNFGDDRMRLRSSRMSRRGVLGRFSPWRTRPFEHVVLRRLSMAGYAYAVSPPGATVYPLGLPKTELPPGTWYDAVRDMARNALCVVVSATPAQLNPGFAWELGMLARELGHERIMLVVGSWRKRALAEAWARFVAATRQYPLFWGIEYAFQTYATHVMIRVPGVGWEAWGARSRSEWTYAAAISLALERATPLWRSAAP